MSVLVLILKIVIIVILAQLVGGFLTGVDRKITARMQSRKGPPVLQPFYDVIKLMQKESTHVSSLTRYFVTFTLVFTAFTVVLLFIGSDILLCIFAFTLACAFFVIAGYSSNSPYSIIGAERELLQIMAYEPMILCVAFGFYGASGTFSISEALNFSEPIIVKLPLIFIGLCYVLTIKLRKSPFDLSMSHHGHQEIVKGITTEFTGRTMAVVEIIHWYETVFSLGLVGIFLVYLASFSILVAAGVSLVIFFIEIVIDNTFARVKWGTTLKISWIVTLVCSGVNFIVLRIM